VAVPSGELAGELTAAGFSESRLAVIPRRVPMPEARSPAQRDAARAALAAVNYDLVTTPTAPVALAVGRLDAEHRFGDLVRAWRIVSARRSEARLWIVGDGPLREQLYRQIGDLDLRFRVLIPGSFDCLREVMQATDLMLVPAVQPATALAVVQALAAGVPLIAAEAPALRELAGEDSAGMFYPVEDIKALADAISQQFDHPGVGIVRAAAIRQHLQSAPPPAAEATSFVELFHRLAKTRTNPESEISNLKSPI
jgi:glycosyltransferase involved in cell wall biosynthesis